MGLTFETTISFISFKEAKMFFVLFFYLLILSETLISSEIEESLKIEEIIVKSTKSLSYIYQLGSSVNVISAEEIAKRGFTFVGEALQGVPGLSISQTGAFGGTTTLAIRGAPSSQTLVLIDGISVNDPSSPGGGYDFSSLLTSNIESIEILKSSQSTLWGSDAIGGIINIITKETKVDPKLNLLFELGEHNSLKYGAGYNFSKNENNFFLSANSYQSKGISKAEKKDGNYEKDGFGSQSYLLKSSHRFLGVDLSTNINYGESDIDYDSYGFLTGVKDGDENTKSRNFNGTLSLKINSSDKKLLNTIIFGSSKINRRYFTNNIQNFFAEGERKSLRYLGNYKFNNYNYLTYGIENEESSTSEVSLNTESFFLLYEVIPFKGSGFSFGLRKDKREDISNEIIPKVTVFMDLSKDWRVKANWGEGFKLPTIFQTTFFCCGASKPNENLLPETSEGYEIGLRYFSMKTLNEFGITYFDQKISNLIDFSYALGAYENIKKVYSKGIELDFVFNVKKYLSFSGSYSYIDAENEEGLILIRIPKNKANINLDFVMNESTEFSISVYYNGKETDPREDVAKWVRTDLNFLKKLNLNKELYIKVKNIFDEKYQDIYGYGTEGRSLYFGLKLSY